MHHQLQAKRRRLTWILGVSALCILFYVLGAWQATPSTQYDFYTKVGCDNNTATSDNNGNASLGNLSINLDFTSYHQVDIESSKTVSQFPPCDMSYSEYTPCQDKVRGRKFNRYMMKYRERHCPSKEEQLLCLIPAPPNYKKPFKWPQSRDYAWYNNIPHKELSIEKAIQNWIQVEGDCFRFPGGGTMFPRGADAYIDDNGELIPLTNGSIRTAVDTGCGISCKLWCLPVEEEYLDNVFCSKRYTRSTGPVCTGTRSSCDDRNHGFTGPGGYWVLSGPPIRWKKYWRGWERTKEDLKQEQDAIEDAAKRLCWKKVTEHNDLAIWRKPINHRACVKFKERHGTPPMCKSQDPDSAWYRNLEACITPLPEVFHANDFAGGKLLKWPERVLAVPPRISRGLVQAIRVDRFVEDREMWHEKIAHYNRLITPLRSGRHRNIMDMNANFGGFAAALSKYPVWVMNVVPEKADSDTLGIIYERGLIGTYQDWCEAFSKYPRTYDLINANGVFTMYQDRCDMTYILLEMDRILRPEGTVIFRDTVELLVKIKSITDGMRWKAQIMDHESGPFNPEKILVAVKTYWTGEATHKEP
ncbi:putative methyltransferase PMT18 [Hibiscus syriacus]|uniref:Methyltransferase n=1 Tax=Hibiscus syriacus TaxID=106335 RepID=A0A6A2YFM7_HIBSY|nr:putative methyltransferase PMT18 [Hibiscus syriacus]